MKYSWRVDESWIALERSPAVEREFDRSFADEVAIDFPALGDKVARMRHAFVESDIVIDWLRASGWLRRSGLREVSLGNQRLAVETERTRRLGVANSRPR